jgi:chromosomal replication initiator protein
MQTFAGWVSLPENRSGRTAVERVALAIRRGGARTTHNPLVLHGPAGSGKTHLVNALVVHVTQAVPGLIVTALAAREVGPQGYEDTGSPETRSADLVVVEDLQHLPAVATEACVQLVDRCRACRQQLVVTAAVGPAQLHRLPSRLATRLSAGLVVRLDPLSPSSRLAFLRDRIKRRGQIVPPDILDWLATHLPGSARQLEGALVKLEALGRLSGAVCTVDGVAEHFQADLEAHRLTVGQIAKRVGQYFQIKAEQMQSPRRSRNTLVPRQVGMYLARQLTPASLQEIGSFFGGRDHSTVLHACRKVEGALTHDVALSGAVHELQTDLA